MFLDQAGTGLPPPPPPPLMRQVGGVFYPGHNPFFSTAGAVSAQNLLSGVVGGINNELKAQSEASSFAKENSEAANCTFSEVFWLGEEEARAENGLGARFLLVKRPKGQAMSEYMIQLGYYAKTKGRNFFYRKKTENKLDLTMQEYKQLLDLAPRMISCLNQLMKVEENRYRKQKK